MTENPPAAEEKPADTSNPIDEKPAEEIPQPETPVDAVPAVTPAEEIPQPETPVDAVAAVTPAEEPQKPARKPWLYRFLYALLSPETRLGRFMRPFLRGAAAVVGLFALGMLATYLLLYAPAAQQLAATRAELQAAQQQSVKTNAALTTAQKDLADVQAKYNQSLVSVKKAGVRVSLLQVSNLVATARLALDNRDGAAAQKALTDARFILDQVLPDVQSTDANAATQLDSRLTLVVSELNDPATAQADLALLAARLADLDNAFK